MLNLEEYDTFAAAAEIDTTTADNRNKPFNERLYITYSLYLIYKKTIFTHNKNKC